MTTGPLQTLFLPLESGMAVLPPGAEILFMNGQPCAGLQGRDALVQQSFRPWFLDLERGGMRATPETPEDKLFDAVLLHNPRQREDNLSCMAAALKVLKPDGLFLCAAANDAGGKRLKNDVESFGMTCQSLSKHKARAVWTQKPQQANITAIENALTAGNYQAVAGGAYVSRPGVFSWDRIDIGSHLLIDNLPEDLAGDGADFGCGFGCLTLALLQKNPQVKTVHCLDADFHAVESCRKTLKKAGVSAAVDYLWVDATDPTEKLPGGLDWIVMNPPFHEGKAALPQVGQGFIKRAATCLKPGGRLLMVANAALPYEATLAELFSSSRRVCQDNGYKIFEAQK